MDGALMQTTYYDRAAVWARWGAVTIAVIVLSLMSGAFGAYLVSSKYAPAVPNTAFLAPVEPDEQLSKLRLELTAMQAKHQQQVDAWHKLRANYKAQIQALTAQVNKSDDQLMVLNEAAQKVVPNLTDRELEEKTWRVLGIVGKVVTR